MTQDVDETSRFGLQPDLMDVMIVEFRFDDGSIAVYTDPLRFGIMDLIEVEKKAYTLCWNH